MIKFFTIYPILYNIGTNTNVHCNVRVDVLIPVGRGLEHDGELPVNVSGLKVAQRLPHSVARQVLFEEPNLNVIWNV